MLREYSLVHESVRSLMMVVKQWANECKICSAQVSPSIVENSLPNTVGLLVSLKSAYSHEFRIIV
jgi:hypothetical protein